MAPKRGQNTRTKGATTHIEVVLRGELSKGLWLRTSIGDGKLGDVEFNTALNIDGKALIINSGSKTVVFPIPWEEIVRKSLAAMATEK